MVQYCQPWVLSRVAGYLLEVKVIYIDALFQFSVMYYEVWKSSICRNAFVDTDLAQFVISSAEQWKHTLYYNTIANSATETYISTLAICPFSSLPLILTPQTWIRKLLSFWNCPLNHQVFFFFWHPESQSVNRINKQYLIYH